MTHPKYKWLYSIMILTSSLVCLAKPLTAQVSPEAFKSNLAAREKNISKETIRFYEARNYFFAWLGGGNHANLASFTDAVNYSASWGLSPSDYKPDQLLKWQMDQVLLSSLEDSINAELSITKEALRFYNHLANGNSSPNLRYQGLRYTPSCPDLPKLLAAYSSNHQLHLLPLVLVPDMLDVKLLEQRVAWFVKISGVPGFSEVVVQSKQVSSGNRELIKKLYQLGIIDSNFANLPDSIVKKKLAEAQVLFNQKADGKLTAATLRELNVGLVSRLRLLTRSLNYYKWLHCLAHDKSVIVVNLPAARLRVYQGNNHLLDMRMIVGKKKTPTPTLSSVVKEVVLYPYWHVPYSIAVKEMLPIIKRNPGYLDKNGYQVMDQSGRIISPYSVNWHALGPGYFPYLIRQSTGCDNALGLLKLNFDNPFGVYLHDTNSKNLFKQERRFFSHGCMRMEKPFELGHLLLRNNPLAIDSLEQKGCLRNKAPVYVPASVFLPVVVWYNPAGVDTAGRLVFYEDIYNQYGRN